jgi:hypothetical protein
MKSYRQMRAVHEVSVVPANVRARSLSTQLRHGVVNPVLKVTEIIRERVRGGCFSSPQLPLNRCTDCSCAPMNVMTRPLRGLDAGVLTGQVDYEGTETKTLAVSGFINPATSRQARSRRIAEDLTLELTLIARRSRVLASGNLFPRYVDLPGGSSLGELLEVLAGHHGFTTSTASTLHVDPVSCTDASLREPWAVRGARYRVGAEGAGDAWDEHRAVASALPPGATGYLCVGEGEWLWYVRSLSLSQ